MITERNIINLQNYSLPKHHFIEINKINLSFHEEVEFLKPLCNNEKWQQMKYK